MCPKNDVTRRTVLRATTGAVTGTSAVGGAGTVGALVTDSSKPVEVNVGFSAESGRQATLSAATDVVREFDFDVLTVRVPGGAVASLAERADVRYVEENGTMQKLSQGVSWGFDRVSATHAHPCSKGDGADIAIIDTGIDSDHPDLAGNLGKGEHFVQCDPSYTNCYKYWDDDDGHGTHVAGTAAAIDNNKGYIGVAPEATLHAVKVLNADGYGTHSDIAAGIEYVANQNWDVGNLSLGDDSGSQTLQDACQYAYNSGVLLVAAAGDSGPCSDCVSYPAKYEQCIAVSAIDRTDTLSDSSSSGPEVELCAPGVEIESADIGGNYRIRSGTSIAAPFVSGTAGLLMGTKYNLPNIDTRERLCGTAEEMNLPSEEQGCGMVDPWQATDC